MAVVVAAGCGSSPPVTIDNGQPIDEISQDDINAWWKSAKQGVAKECQSARDNQIVYKRCIDKKTRLSREEVFSGLIGDAWIINEAKAKGVVISPKDQNNLRSGVSKIAKANPGLPRTTLIGRLKAQILLNRLSEKVPGASRVKVSNSQALQYYREETSSFLVPQKRDLIVLPAPNRITGEGIAARLRKGDQVAMILKEAGAPAGLVKKPTIRSVTENQIPERARRVFRSADEEVVGPIDIGQDWIVVKTIKIYPQSRISFQDAAPKIKQQLRRQFLRQRAIGLLQDKWRPRTVCGQGYSSPLCRNRSDGVDG